MKDNTIAKINWVREAAIARYPKFWDFPFSERALLIAAILCDTKHIREVGRNPIKNYLHAKRVGFLN